MVAKSESPGAALLLDEVLQESRTHRELFKHASKVLGHSASSVADCGKQMGGLFLNSVELIRNIKTQVLHGMPIVEAVEKLVKFEEDAASEEDVTLLYANVASVATLDMAMKRVLEGIAQDEKHHAENLRLIVKMLKK